MEGEALRGVVPLRDPSLQLPYPLRPGTAFTDVQPFEPAGVFHPLYFAMYKDGKTCARARGRGGPHGSLLLGRVHDGTIWNFFNLSV